MSPLETRACLLCQSKAASIFWRQSKNLNWSLYGRIQSSEEPEATLDFYSCRDCGLIFKDPAHFVAPELEKSCYLRHQNDVAESGYRSFLQRLSARLIERLSPGMQGLDFGCGPSLSMALLFQDAGFACESYDPYFFPRHDLLARKYDFVSCSEVAEHFNDPRAGFAQLRALLKPGAWLGLMTQAPPENFESWHYHKDPTHIVFYSAKTLRWLAEHYEMSVVAILPQGVTIFSAPS